ncbi:MAG: hypothetical protein GXO78_06695 [Calditrichaeota bacterium]|nr:hypothetical protein [Calditrichota bacterium]
MKGRIRYGLVLGLFLLLYIQCQSDRNAEPIPSEHLNELRLTLIYYSIPT